MKYYS